MFKLYFTKGPHILNLFLFYFKVQAFTFTLLVESNTGNMVPRIIARVLWFPRDVLSTTTKFVYMLSVNQCLYVPDAHFNSTGGQNRFRIPDNRSGSLPNPIGNGVWTRPFACLGSYGEHEFHSIFRKLVDGLPLDDLVVSHSAVAELEFLGNKARTDSEQEVDEE